MTQRIGVVGGGLMGSGIAEVCARAGRDVVVAEANAPAADAARARIEKSLRRAAERGKIDDRRGGPRRIRFATELDDLADRELVIEAIVETKWPRPTCSPSSTRSSSPTPSWRPTRRRSRS